MTGAGLAVVTVPALVAELLVVAVVVREAAVPSSPRWSRWCGPGGRVLVSFSTQPLRTLDDIPSR
jgi:hypothetical protein